MRLARSVVVVLAAVVGSCSSSESTAPGELVRLEATSDADCIAMLGSVDTATICVNTANEPVPSYTFAGLQPGSELVVGCKSATSRQIVHDDGNTFDDRLPRLSSIVLDGGVRCDTVEATSASGDRITTTVSGD
jgi:hypothetical protein